MLDDIAEEVDGFTHEWSFREQCVSKIDGEQVINVGSDKVMVGKTGVHLAVATWMRVSGKLSCCGEVYLCRGFAPYVFLGRRDCFIDPYYDGYLRCRHHIIVLRDRSLASMFQRGVRNIFSHHKMWVLREFTGRGFPSDIVYAIVKLLHEVSHV